MKLNAIQKINIAAVFLSFYALSLPAANQESQEPLQNVIPDPKSSTVDAGTREDTSYVWDAASGKCKLIHWINPNKALYDDLNNHPEK